MTDTINPGDRVSWKYGPDYNRQFGKVINLVRLYRVESDDGVHCIVAEKFITKEVG